MSEIKALHRTRLAAARRAVPRQVAAEASRAIAERVIGLPVFRAAGSVLLYSATADEVETAQLRRAAERDHKSVYYPRFRGPEGEVVEFVRVRPGDQLCAGARVPAQPDAGEVFCVGQPCLVVVPGIGFDLRGNRLGRGGGWYDRALQQLRPPALCVGLAFAVQVVASLPRDEWDQHVDLLVTECETLHLRVAGAAAGQPVGEPGSGRVDCKQVP